MRAVSWAVVVVACARAPSAPPPAPPPPAPKAVPKPAPAADEPAEPADAVGIWEKAIAGDVAGARRSLEWFRAHPPEKPHAAPDYRPNVVCSEDATRCAFSLTYPAGTGVTDGSGNALRRLDTGMSGPFSFVGTTHLVFVQGTPGSVFDADSGEAVLALPDASWSTVDIGVERLVFALDYVREAPDSEAGEVAEQRVGVWDVASRRMLFENTSQLGEYPSVFLSSDQSMLLVSSKTGAYAFNLADSRLVAAALHPDVGAPISAQGEHVAIASYGKAGAEVRLVARSGKIVARSRACANPRVVELSPSGKLLAVVGERHLCALEVPSLAQVFRSPPLPKPAEDWDGPNHALFGADERVVVLGTKSGQATLFELAGARRQHAAGKVEARAAKNGAIALIDRTQKTLVLMRDFQEVARRPLNDAELGDPESLPEIGEPRQPDRGSELASRLKAQLCMVHGHAFPPALCAVKPAR